MKKLAPKMSPKLRHKLFVVASGIAAGKTTKEAMMAAGYAENTAEAGQLRHTDEQGRTRALQAPDHPVVAEFLEDMRHEVRSKARIDLQTIVRRLDWVFQKAAAAEDLAQARLATVDLAKVLGPVVERRELSVKRLEDMSEAELAFVLGEEDAGASAGLH